MYYNTKSLNINRVTKINVDTKIKFNRDLHALPFTKEEQLKSFSLFQEELKKDKFIIGR